MDGNGMYTPPETNSSHLKIGHPERKLGFQPSIFRCHVSFREGKHVQKKIADISRLEAFQVSSLWVNVEAQDGGCPSAIFICQDL